MEPPGKLRKPDLIFVKKYIALVVDVTLRYEVAFESLEVAKSQKIVQSPHCSGYPKKATWNQQGHLFGFPVGARGKWPTRNNQVLRAMGESDCRRTAFAKLVSRRVLLYSRIFPRGPARGRGLE